MTRRTGPEIVACGIKTTGMDSSAAFVDRQGNVVFFAEDERFNRHKHGWDVECPAYLSYMRRYRPGNGFDVVLPIEDYRLLDRRQSHLDTGQSLEAAMAPLEVYQRRFNFTWNIAVEVLGIDPGRIHLYPHHLCHGASAFYPSGFAEAAVLVFDGQAELHCMSLGTAVPGDIRFFHTQPFTHSLAKLYSKITDWLGLGSVGSEWKTMGLASYGKPTFVKSLLEGAGGVGPVLTWGPGPLELTVNFNNFLDIFGPPSAVGDSPSREQMDMAASIQAFTEDYLVDVARHLRNSTGLERLCFAGGMAYNVRCNQRILEERLFKEVYVFPAAGDAGVSLGAACHHAHVLGKGRLAPRRMPSMYTGPEITPAQARKAVACSGLVSHRPRNLAAYMANELAQGKIVGLARGAMESGPRALGHRSILADPCRADAKDRINSAVKYREWWRPFAPMVMEEEVGRFFDPLTVTPYMITTSKSFEQSSRIPAVVHVDGTSRVQVVSARREPFLHNLLSEVRKITGCGVLLNTSFNLKGEPIVMTAEDALDTFWRCQLDLVVVDGLVCTRPEGASLRPKQASERKPQFLSLDVLLGRARRLLVMPSCSSDQLQEALAHMLGRPGAEADVLLPEGYECKDLGAAKALRLPFPGYPDWSLSGVPALSRLPAEPYDALVHLVPEQGWYYYQYTKHYSQERAFLNAFGALARRSRGRTLPVVVCPAHGVSHELPMLEQLLRPVWRGLP